MSICVKRTKSTIIGNHAKKLNIPLLLGLKVSIFALFPFYTQAIAQTVTINDEIETNLLTSTANSGSAANIIIGNEGQLVVSGGTAITVDSNHSITNEGLISSEGLSNTTGIHFKTVNAQTLISNFNNNSQLTVGKADDDGTLGTGNYGILIDGAGTYQGDINFSTGSSVGVFGDNSFGLSLRTNMIGDLNLKNVSVAGENSYGVEILGNLTGDLNLDGSSLIAGKNSYGVYVEGDISGHVDNLGVIATGTNLIFDRDFNAIPAVGGLAGVRISGNVGGGFSNNIQYTDSDGNIVNVVDGGSTTGLNINKSSLNSLGGGYALWITPEKINTSTWSDITIGNTGSFFGDYSIVNQGDILVRGINKGQSVTAIYITGAVKGGTTYTTTLDEGIFNGAWGSIVTNAVDASATSIHIDNNVTVPEIVNHGILNAIASMSTDEDGVASDIGGNAYGIIIEQNSSVLRFENTGSMAIGGSGAASSAYGILDHSGTISDFSNSGTIAAEISQGSTGKAIAVDLSMNTSGVTFFNSGIIKGDIYLGTGTNFINLEGLDLTEVAAKKQEILDANNDPVDFPDLYERGIDGTLFLGGGSATLNMIDNATLLGGIFSPNGQLEVSLKDQTELGVRTSLSLKVQNLTVEDQSKVRIRLDGENNFTGGIVAAGDVSFLDDSQLIIQVEGVIVDEGTFRIIDANTLTIDEGRNVQNNSSNPFIYDVNTVLTGSSLDLTIRRKGSAELGLSTNVGNIYEASISALLEDTDAAIFINDIKNIDDFNRIYKEMMPNSFSQITRQVILNSNNLSVGAISGQLDNLRQLLEYPKPQRVRRALWVQELGGFYNQRDGESEKGGNVFDFGLAMGYDVISNNRGALGVSFAYNIADVKLNGSGENRVTIQNFQVGIYDALWFNKFFLESQASIGHISFSSERDVVFDDFTRTANANWSGLQYAGNLKVGYQFKKGSFALVPTAAINYNHFKQDSYTETDGGTAVNLNVDEFTSKSITGDFLLELSHTTDFKVGERVEASMKFDLHGGYSKEFEDTPDTMTLRFAGFDDTFSLVGNPLITSSYQVGAGFYYTSPYTSFGIKYDLRIKDGYSGHSATVNFRVRF